MAQWLGGKKTSFSWHCLVVEVSAVAKPLVADGTAKSHALSLAYDKYCLTELEPPLVLQEFVNHGAPLDHFISSNIKLRRSIGLRANFNL